MKNHENNVSLEDLFVLKIKSLYDVEQQLTKALPKMAEHSNDSSLASGFKEHLVQTKGHVHRLEEIFKLLELEPQKTKVEAIRGLTEDADWVIKNVKDNEALDAALIGAAQYVEHYEIAGYGTAREWARLLGMERAAALLEETLEEEKAANEKLNTLAKTKINKQAMPVES